LPLVLSVIHLGDEEEAKARDIAETRCKSLMLV
jgi:hypothetical protein